MSCFEVRYSIEGFPRSRKVESMEDAEAYMVTLIATYGDEYIQDLVIEKQERC